MTKPTAPQTFPVEEILKSAEVDLSKTDYGNHVQCIVTPNEMVLDLYLVTAPAPPEGPPIARFIRRIMIPIVHAKALTSALANSIALFEEHNGCDLPNTRDPQPEDKAVIIWKP